MGTDEYTTALYECQSCDNIGAGEGTIFCCGEPMEPVDGGDLPIEEPDAEQVVTEVFGLSETKIEICLYIMEAGEATTNEVAAGLELDRSNVSRHLNDLTEFGAIEKRQRLLEEGGYVFLYSSAPIEEVRQRFRHGLYVWLNKALAATNDLTRAKIERMIDRSDDDGAEIYHENG